MALFVLFFLVINNCLDTLLGYESNNNALLEIKPSTITAGKNVGFYKVDDTLNLTCTFRNDSILPNAIMEWIIPSKASNSQNRAIQRPGTNYVVLTIENLQENDSGEYKCRVVHNGIQFFNLENSVKINVKNKKKECPELMFACSAVICIPKRYICDGFKDCPNGEDESPLHCGPGNPCDDKFMCPDERCIPFTWCCESHREPNCSTKIKHSCCTHVEKLTRDVDSDMGYQYEQQRFSDMGFLQTTVYTVIGCAMAFMFIVTIIVIAICRVHVRRTLLSRCPTANRNLVLGRGGNLSGNHLNGGLSFFDLDLYLNRSGLHGNDLMSVNPLLVTYNINNGVQFVGRPIDPPPYCEIVTSPPKEGPPPPYASRENLCGSRRWPKEEEEESKADVAAGERSEEGVDAEVTESDALLGATRQNISVISREAVEVAPAVEEVPRTVDAQESRKRCAISGDTSSKDCMHTQFSSDSSHCFAAVGECKNSGSNSLVLNSCDSVVAEVPGTEKVQNEESSSYASGEVSSISKGAVKRILGTDSSESGTRRKSGNFF